MNFAVFYFGAVTFYLYINFTTRHNLTQCTHLNQINCSKVNSSLLLFALPLSQTHMNAFELKPSSGISVKVLWCLIWHVNYYVLEIVIPWTCHCRFQNNINECLNCLCKPSWATCLCKQKYIVEEKYEEVWKGLRQKGMRTSRKRCLYIGAGLWNVCSKTVHPFPTMTAVDFTHARFRLWLIRFPAEQILFIKLETLNTFPR